MLAHQWLPLSSFFDWTFKAILLLFTQKAPINYYIFTATSGGPYALALMSSLRNIIQWNVKSTIFARRKESTPSAMHLIGQIWALTSNFRRTSFCTSNRFILNHVDNWTKQWQAGAAQLPLLGAPCFYWTSQICLFAFLLIKNWPKNIHCRTF